ncbi:MAG: OTU domain-containing protein, partial [Aquiluna sp.]
TEVEVSQLAPPPAVEEEEAPGYTEVEVSQLAPPPAVEEEDAPGPPAAPAAALSTPKPPTSGQIFNVPADGNCFFHAVAAVTGIPFSRTMLLEKWGEDDTLLPNRDHSVVKQRIETGGWVEEDEIQLTVDILNRKILIWVDVVRDPFWEVRTPRESEHPEGPPIHLILCGSNHLDYHFKAVFPKGAPPARTQQPRAAKKKQPVVPGNELRKKRARSGDREDRRDRTRRQLPRSA